MRIWDWHLPPGASQAAFAIRTPQLKLRNSSGGIAQLVERQLCKLEVRGSNPLASNFEKIGGNVQKAGTLSDALAGA